MSNLSHRRHLAKTITWRIVGTVDTVILSWIITGNPFTGLKIGLAEVLSKMILYYLHERAWFNFGMKDSTRRHLSKTVTWRVIGTADTMLLSWIITGNPLTGLQIGVAEIITKMFLYYLHERGWHRVNFGLDKRKRVREWGSI